MFGCGPGRRTGGIETNAPWAITLTQDIGGNVGTYAISTLLLYPQARVVTVEPTLRNRVFLEHNAKQNNVAQRLTVLPHAISSDGRTLYIQWREKNPASSRVVDKKKKGQRYVEEVPTRSLQAILEELGEFVNVVKIDCEGCEQEVLLGTPALMDREKVWKVL